MPFVQLDNLIIQNKLNFLAYYSQ